MLRGAVSKARSSQNRSFKELRIWSDMPTDIHTGHGHRYIVEQDQWRSRTISSMLLMLDKIETEEDLEEKIFLLLHFAWHFGIDEKSTMLEDDFLTTISEEQAEEQDWPTFASEEFGKIVENTKGLEDASDDRELVLYHIMEIETLLADVEKKARATNYEYEARLAASLRDICRIHEPSELSDEQIKCFTGSLQALVEGWGALNREKLKWIRSRLLEVGLTWLPVTEKAQKVIDEAKSSVK